MKAAWSDGTIYNQKQSNRGGEHATVWELAVHPYMTILVHRMHKDTAKWYFTCHGLNIGPYQLKEPTLVGAQSEAIKILTTHLRKLSLALAEYAS
jgi:hypothetical protein